MLLSLLPLLFPHPVLQEAGAPARADVAPVAAPAGSVWTQWRGAERDGQFRGAAWPETLDAEHLTLAWKVEGLGPSYATPVVTGEQVFTVSSTDDGHELVQAFDRASGKELWSTDWEGSMKVPFFAARNGSWVRSSPAYDGEALFVAGMRDVLVCLEGDSGEVRWRVDFVERDGSPLPAFGFVCSPLVTDDAVYVQAGGAFARLDKRTGDTVWRALADSGGMDSTFSSPILTTLYEREQLVVLTRTTLAGVDIDSGAALWSRPIKADRDMNILTPLNLGDAIFTAPYGGKSQLLTFAAEEGGVKIEQAWTARSQGYMSTPVVVDGHLYFFARSNRFVCTDARTGEETFVSGPTGDSYWSLVAQGERILALSDTGIVRLIAADPSAYTVLGEVDLEHGSTWAHLAVVDGQLFVRAQNALLAYDWR